MWFGTEDGLNKYDGYQFAVYKHDPDNSSTLSDDEVSAIYEDRSGNLWIGTHNGLNRFDRTTGTFTCYQHDPDDPQSLSWPVVLSICEDRAGTLWVGTEGGGLGQLDQATNTFTHYQHAPDDPRTLSDDSVYAIYKDRSGELWVGTDGGLDRFDRTTGTFTHYRHDPNDLQSLGDNSVRVIFEDRQGVLWIGTDGGGLDRMDRPSQTFIHYEHSPGDLHGLSDNRVQAILEDGAGRLWVGSPSGLDLLDRSHNRFVHYQHDPNDPHSLSDNMVYAIYEDRSGVLWIGTGLGGLSKYSRATDQFTLYQHRPNTTNSLSDNAVYSIYGGQSGNLWIGTKYGGLNRLDRNSDTFTVYQHDPDNPASLSSNQVRTILEDHTSALWIGTRYGGLNQFEPQTETFTHYRHDPNDPGSLSEDWVSVIYKDRSDNLWIGTWDSGLDRLDRATGTFVHYQHDPNDPSSLSSNSVRSIYEDPAGMLWVGTSGGGISLLDRDNNRFTHYAHDPDDPQSLSSNDSVLSIYEDATGTVWIASYGGGLNRFDRATQTFTHYTEKDGLPNDMVYCILPDSEEFLWISTNSGLSKFDPRTEVFRNYDVRDGLQSNEFNYGACFQSDSGEMFFGGIQGFSAFFPEQVEDNPHLPPIVITAFSKFNQTVRTDLTANEHLQLSYKDNFISFEFAALDYTAPDKNQYAYMLERQDEDWVYAGTRRHADYTNLRGGDYVFRVKGSNNDGVWNEEGVAVYITVTPPVWETWWFRGIVVLLLVGSVISGYRLRVRSIEARSRELENQVEERTHEIEQRTQELEALYRADGELYRHLHLDEVLQALVDIAVDILQVDKSSLMVWDQRRERLAMKFARGFRPEFVAQMSFAWEEGVIGHLVASGEPIIVEDALTDPRREGERAEVLSAVDLEGIGSFMHVPIKIGDEAFGVFSLIFADPHAFGNDEQRLFVSLAQRAALAIENAQLHEQAQELAIVEERQRLARDLHDSVTQALYGMTLHAKVASLLLSSGQVDLVADHVREMQDAAQEALGEMRLLIFELRPPVLEEGLVSALQARLEAVESRAGLKTEFNFEGEIRLPPEIEEGLYRIAQEALNNALKHAQAHGITVSLRHVPHQRIVVLEIADDGMGFDPAVARDQGGMGLRGMEERAAQFGGQLTIQSRPGAGTSVRVEVYQ